LFDLKTSAHTALSVPVVSKIIAVLLELANASAQ